MSAANEPDATNQRAKVAVLSEKVVDTNPYSRLMCAGRHRHAAVPPTDPLAPPPLQGAEEDGCGSEL